MKRVLSILLAVSLSLALSSGCRGKGRGNEGPPPEPRDTLYQVSILGALSQGVFDGEVDYATLRRHGDCGIGTFQGLDGEMVALDGSFWQVRTDGVPVPVEDTQKAPFAMVTFFEEDLGRELPSGLDYAGLQAEATRSLPSPNLFCAVRVEGEFDRLKIRSVPGQQPPYPSLPEVVAQQTVWELERVEGTMIGFYCPPFLGGVNQAGFHLHFISRDLQHGGHVLDCRIAAATLALDITDGLSLHLPDVPAFRQADLAPK